MGLTQEEKDQIREDDLRFDAEQDDLYTAQDEWIKENLQDLKDEFCLDNDDFKDYCREQYKMWSD